MRRIVILSLLAALASGCSSQSVAAGATIVGAHDLVQIDTLLFTTSTDRDELRVLDLVPPGLTVPNRQYVRAPNPIEALSIPVLKRPSALSRDTHYEDYDGGTPVALGNEVGGPWVYATRAGGAEISIVGGGPQTDPAQLSEVRRVATAAPVTASAGVRVTAKQSRLYFATASDGNATLLSIDLPTTPAALKAEKLTQTVLRPPLLGEVVVDLVAVPGISGRSICADPARTCIIYATRTMQGRAGRVVLFDPEKRVEKELHFPAAVRLLAVHAAIFHEGVYFAPGKRVFGVLDEEQCGGSQCNGVVAVDTFTGELALDAANLPMLPISSGNALPTGLTIVPRGSVLLPPELVPAAGITIPTVVALSALGVITTSTGAFVFFDAAGLTELDLNAAAPRGDVVLVRDDGVRPDAGYIEGPNKLPGDAGFDVRFAEGAWNPETIDVVVRGLIPGLVGLPIVDDGGVRMGLADGGTQYRLDVAPSVVDRALVGDRVVFFGKPGEPGGDCGGMIIQKPQTGTPPTVQLLAESNCKETAKAVGFGVRAEGPKPYVLTGTSTGFLGRGGPNQSFTYQGAYLQHVVRLDPATRKPIPFDPSAPTLTIPFGPEATPVPQDWRWVIDVQPNRTPFNMRVDSQSVGCVTTLAGSVVYDVPRQSIFAIFPSASAIIEVNPLVASSGTRTTGNLCHR